MSVQDSDERRLCEALDELRSEGRYRELQCIDGGRGPVVQVGDRRLVMFSSNDYLGLASAPALVAAAHEALERYGLGATASRLICGTSPAHLMLERRFAEFVGKSAALLFGSGYAANLGVIATLADDKSVIYSDELNHASIIDGCRLSKARRVVYRHGAAGDLEQQLLRHPAGYRAVIVTESLFGMDGDRAPLPELAALAARYEALLIVDEAHALGVLGPEGRGLVWEAGLTGAVDVIVGTFGKAFGVVGAAVACSANVRDYLVNRARCFVYTTAPPPMMAAATLAAFPLVQSGELQARLRLHWARLRAALDGMGFPVDERFSPILPVILGADRRTMRVSEAMRNKGFLVQGIRPPTVPEGTSRLRLTVMASHEDAHLTGLVDALRETLKDETRSPI